MSNFTQEQLKKAREEVVRVQVERFHEYYSSYFQKEETIKMASFFFESIYNLNGKEEWHALAIDAFQKAKNMLKETTRENLERLIELNDLTDELDFLLAEEFLNNGWNPGTKISQLEYAKFFKQMGHPEDRVKQVKIVLHNLRSFYELAHRPINSYIIKPAAFMAKMLGVYPLFQRLEEGYYATLPVSPQIFESFMEEVKKKEKEFLVNAFPDVTLDVDT
jgi:hypothetical protein